MAHAKRTQCYLEEELYSLMRQGNSTFGFLQDACLDGLWYWDLEDPDNEWMSPRFWEVLGYDPSKKKHLASEWQDIINQDDLRVAIENFKQHCANPDHPYDQVVRYRHQNGSTVWVRCRGIAIRDETGKPIRLLGAHTDITQQKEMEAKFARSSRELEKEYAAKNLVLEESEMLFDAAPDAILRVEENGNISKANARAAEMFGYSDAEFVTLNIEALLPAAQRDTHRDHIKAYFKHGKSTMMGSARGQFNAIRKNGETFAVEISLSTVELGSVRYALAIIRDVTEKAELIEQLQKQLNEIEELKELALIDPLTKAYNVRYLQSAMVKAYGYAKRNQQPLSVLVMDIDHFKDINDQHGHACGDDVLKLIASHVKSCLRYEDEIVRMGGDEFLAILPNTGTDSAMSVADRIHFGMSRFAYEKEDGETVEVRMSIGVASLSEKDRHYQRLIERADKALYRSKEQGRNRVSFIDDKG